MLPSIILIPMTDLGHFLLGPTGLISRELTAHTKSILGVDISQGVVDFYNNRFASQGLPSEKVHAIVAELDPDSPQTIPIELKDQKFDLVFVSTCEHIAYYSKINGRFKSARWRTTIFLTSTQKQGCLPPSSHRAGHYSSSTSSKPTWPSQKHNVHSQNLRPELMGGLLPGDTHILMNTRIRTLTSIPLRLATAALLRFTATSNMA